MEEQLAYKIVSRRVTSFKEYVAKEETLWEDRVKRRDGIGKLCKELSKKSNDLSLVRSLLEQCNIASRAFIKTELETLVTKSLQDIYEMPDIKFIVNFKERRNQVEADFSVMKSNKEVPGDLMDSHGGGIIDIVSISLRVIVMQLFQLEGPLIMDEPGKNISDQYIDNFGKFLGQVSDVFKRQIILITHNTKLAQYANNTIEVTMKKEMSIVTCAK